MAKTYNDYKKSKKLQSGLFWAIIIGILAAIIIPVILISTSIAQVNKQRDELENELREDFNNIDLLPNNLSKDEENPYTNLEDFINRTSIDFGNTNPFSTSQNLKEEYLKTNQTFVLPFLSSLLPTLNDILSSFSDKSIATNEFTNNVGLVNVADSTETNLESNANFKNDGKNKGLIAVELPGSSTMFPIFEKDTFSLIPTTPLAAFSLSSIRIIDSVTDDGKYWWEHNDKYFILGNEYINTIDNINPDVWYFNFNLKIPSNIISGILGIEIPNINFDIYFEVKNPSVNFMYQINLFENSNRLSNLLIGIGLIESVDENGDNIYNMDYSNIFFTMRSWLEYVSNKYNTSEINGIYEFIYNNDSIWKEEWNELFNDDVLSDSALFEDLINILSFIDYDTFVSSSPEYQDIFKSKIQNPDFEMFFEIMIDLNLIFDQRFDNARESILESMIDTVDLNDLPYPY